MLHCFEDPSFILREIARVCKHSIVIEADHVEVALNGTIREPSTSSLAEGVASSPHIATGIPILQLAPQSLVNKSGKLMSTTKANRSQEEKDNGDDGDGDEDSDDGDDDGKEDTSKGFGSFTGVAVVPSRNFIEKMLIALGFNGKKNYFNKKKH